MSSMATLLSKFKRHVYEFFRTYLPRPVKRFLRLTILKTGPNPFPLTEITSWSFPSSATDSSLFDVIIFPIIDWDFRFQRPQQIASCFAKAGHRVFYLRTTITRRRNPAFRRISDRIWEIGLPSPAPVNIYSDCMTQRIKDDIDRGFNILRERFGIVEAVSFVELPFWTPAAMTLRQTFGWKVIYDCMDDHSGFANTSQEMLKLEQDLTRNSDLVFATSRSLYTKESSINPNCVLVPNAVDFDHFQSTASNIPEDTRNIPKPVIGYYGAISDWFDVDLVREIASSRAHWNFVLIGHTFGSNLEPLRALKNVHLLEEKPYSILPPYLRAFDVAIIPFKKTPLTDATNPVKLFEFLSADKPVVASDLAELQNYSDFVKLVSTTDDWVRAIEDSLNENKIVSTEARIEFARNNSWEHRFQQIQQCIGKLYPRISIIIITYNNLDYNRLCLESIYRNTIYPDFEIIVVDNASTDGTPEFLRSFAESHPDIRVILNDANEGFAAGNNRGIGAASGEYIVLLNNDTVVTRGWLCRLIYHLGKKEVGMVGPVTNWSGNESRIPVDYTDISQMETFAQKYTRSNEGQTFSIRMLALFCVALRRSVVDEIGLLDERFGIGMFEDDDYSRRIREKGYEIICAEDVFIHHWGRASFSRMDESEYYRLFDENRLKFEEKWQIKWQPHQYRQQG
jgi:GT2 family glycosyltransferase/glycosyltransferase involved in cell wall biosynthesis